MARPLPGTNDVGLIILCYWGCPMHCRILAASLIFTNWMLVLVFAFSLLSGSCDNRKCLQT